MRKVTSLDIQAGDYADVLSTINLIEQSFDEGSFDVHESLLSNDFSFVSPFGNYTRVSDYMSWVKSFYETVLAQGGTRHLITNPIAHIEGTQATVFSYLVVLNRKTMAFMGTSALEDTLRKDGARWRCLSRVLVSDQFSGAAPSST